METWTKSEVTHHQQGVLHLSIHSRGFDCASSCFLPNQSNSQHNNDCNKHREVRELQKPTTGWWYRRHIHRSSCGSTELQGCSLEDINDKSRPSLRERILEDLSNNRLILRVQNEWWGPTWKHFYSTVSGKFLKTWSSYDWVRIMSLSFSTQDSAIKAVDDETILIEQHPNLFQF